MDVKKHTFLCDKQNRNLFINDELMHILLEEIGTFSIIF